MNTQTVTKPQSTHVNNLPEVLNPHDSMMGQNPNKSLSELAQAMAQNGKHDGSGFSEPTPEQIAEQQRITQFKRFAEETKTQQEIYDGKKNAEKQEIKVIRAQLQASAKPLKNTNIDNAVFADTPVTSIEGAKGLKAYFEALAIFIRNLTARDSSDWSRVIQGKNASKTGKLEMAKKIHSTITNPDKNVAGFTSGQ